MVTVRQSLLKNLMMVMIIFSGYSCSVEAQNIFKEIQIKTDAFKELISEY